MDWKCPKEVMFLKELPRNKMGKVLKEEVIKLFIPERVSEKESARFP
jgi:acyl-coenzyme A synthetase/AMP-(fatty) acid ligase